MRTRWFHRLIAAGIVATAANMPAAAEGNPERGKTLFQACAACHSLDAKVNKLGPSLNGILGRPSASAEGFLYSPAMRRAKIVWTPELLNAYLESPQSGVFKGNKMPFAGLSDATDRADLIAYIQDAGK
jgi:cytochrome c